MGNKFYVYFHINPLKNEIFYVGKGYGNRAYDKRGRNSYWKNVVNKYGLIINIIEDGLDELKAFEREKFYIKKIGRDKLVNMTDGGEGSTGRSSWNKGMKYYMNPETKEKISKTMKEKYKYKKHPSKGGISWNKGRKLKSLSIEHKEKISNSLLGIKRGPQSEETKMKANESRRNTRLRKKLDN